MRTKEKSILLAIFLGWLGGHKFYLGEKGKGILYLLFFWTAVPCVVSFIDAFKLVLMSEDAFNEKYNGIALNEEDKPQLSDKDEAMRAALKKGMRKAAKKGLFKLLGL